MVEKFGYYGLLFYCLSVAASRAAVHVSIAVLAVLFLGSLLRNWLGSKPPTIALLRQHTAVDGRGLACFVLGMGISLLASDNLSVSLKTIVTFAYYFLPLFFIDAFIRTKEQLDRLCRTFAVSVIIGGAYAIFQGVQGATRAKGFVGIMDLGGVLGLLVPMMIVLGLWKFQKDEKRSSFVFLIAGLIGVCALLANGTRINWIGVMLAFGWFFVSHLRSLSWKMTSIIIVIGIGILALASTNSHVVERFYNIFAVSTDPAVYKRIDMWHYGIGVFLQHWLIGVGIGVLPELAFNELQRITHIMSYGHYGHVHSVYIQLLSETGVVGLTSYCYFLFRTVIKPWIARTSLQQPWPSILIMLLISFIVNGLTDYILGIGQIVYAFAILTAISLKGMGISKA